MGGICGIGLVPSKGKVGTTTTMSISSSAFPLDGDYKILWNPTASFEEDKTILLAEGNVPRGGSSVTASFTIPEAVYGINYVRFLRVARDDPVNLQFTVEPHLEIDPSPATPGTTVTIRGTGFPSRDDVMLTFDGKLTDTNIVTNDVGSFTTYFTTPTTTGKYEFTADSPHMYTKTGTASLEVVPSIDNDTDTTGENDADTIPKAEPDNSASSNSPSGGEPPPRLTTITPREQSFGCFSTRAITFNWTGVNNPNDITYTLEIADNYEFRQIKPGMRKQGLTQTSSTVSIGSGTYYWRVKAVDSAGNEGEWAYSPYQFKETAFPIWILIIGGLIFVLILVLIIRSSSRRLDEYYY